MTPLATAGMLLLAACTALHRLQVEPGAAMFIPASIQAVGRSPLPMTACRLTSSLTVLHGAALSLELDPASTSVPTSYPVTYRAYAVDSLNNHWEVTSETAFSIDAGAGGSWSNNVYTTQNTGVWTVSGLYAGLSGSASLEVIFAPQPTCVTFQRGPLRYGVGFLHLEIRSGR